MIYRAKFVPTVFAARQFVNHGHVKVNGRRVNIPSFQVKVGDLVEIKESSRQLPLVMEANALAERDVPDYVEVDHAKGTAKLTRIPHLSEVPYPTRMEPNLVIEFYSRYVRSRASAHRAGRMELRPPFLLCRQSTSGACPRRDGIGRLQLTALSCPSLSPAPVPAHIAPHAPAPQNRPTDAREGFAARPRAAR